MFSQAFLCDFFSLFYCNLFQLKTIYSSNPTLKKYYVKSEVDAFRYRIRRVKSLFLLVAYVGYLLKLVVMSLSPVRVLSPTTCLSLKCLWAKKNLLTMPYLVWTSKDRKDFQWSQKATCRLQTWRPLVIVTYSVSGLTWCMNLDINKLLWLSVATSCVAGLLISFCLFLVSFTVIDSRMSPTSFKSKYRSYMCVFFLYIYIFL